MIASVTGQALSLFGLALVGLMLSKATGIEKSLWCLATGFVAGLLVGPLSLDTGIRADNVQDLVFYLLLPPVLFRSAWHMPPKLLKRWLLPIALFATLGSVLHMLGVATISYASINHAGFPLIAGLLCGAMLAASDPVAVLSRESSDEDTQDIRALIVGESVFSAPVAAVLYSVLLGVAVEASPGVGAGAAAGAVLISIGGAVLLGIGAGLLAAILVLFFKSSVLASLILVLTAFGSFYVAHDILDLSGMLAVATSALVSRACLKNFEQQFLQDAEATWEWLGAAIVALVYVLMGLVIVPAMFVDQWLAIVIAIVAALVSRTVMIYLCSPLSSSLLRRRRIKPEWRLLIALGGVPGAVAIALVLALPVTLDYWYTVQSMVFGVVLFGLVVQRTAFSMLLRQKLNNGGS